MLEEEREMHSDSDLATLLLEHRLTRFLYDEARLLDEWRLQEWLELFTDDAVYVVPTTDHPKAIPSRDLTLIHDDRKRLAYRVKLLLGERAWAENPMSRTRHVVGNIRLASRQDDICRVDSSFTVHRFRHGNIQTFIGRYEHELAAVEGRIRIRRRTAILDHETLTPHGMVSIIL
ncbi:aromatic-ring-hydroxylating dioxygenase subunit beta [Verminephrobacter aporrectodeae]|uniref:aromatic-ring-hydroxylating dioxygenase subunit beta n=1 Tax=Verminephrobacter aporrectodeae TaxID=1110389 RepID=UPI002243EC04|nr:aromatic-ring-hydroxylating dioxygenase subunit beta [Verminephrobacter aporrectodeae]MCW8175302.1 p-cumate dioxygenase [Verminephrobacter aporrectodeae subsp. tuberculatae]MCW8202787.1 p-cumate dioxygenase [Verminephrobacter aporrectodeae subsp. tuberculatae]